MTRTTREADLPGFVNDYLPALLAQASNLLSSEFHAIVVAGGFTVSEWRVLATLSDGQPMTVGRLVQITVTKQPTITRVLDRLEVKGHVERLAHEIDRRITLVRITKTGRQVAARLAHQAREHEKRVLEPFGLQRAEKLKASLRGIIASQRAPATKAEVESTRRKR